MKPHVCCLIFAISFLMICCESKEKISITSDLELGETRESNPTISSLKKAMKTIDLKLEYVDQQTKRESDLITAVDNGTVDVAIVKNDVNIHDSYANIRTLLPLFPDVLLVLCRNDTTKLSIQELFASSNAAMVIDKEEEKNVIDLFLKKNGADPSRLKQIHQGDSSEIIEALNDHDVLVMFASLNTAGVRNILRSWDGQLYSLDDPALKGQGSIVDGFCLAYPKAVPYIIPKGTYGKWPLQPVLTFAIYDVLICHEDFDVNVAYSMVKTVYEMSSVLAEDDFEFGLLDPNIEYHRFSFPLHPATLKYMTRDQPTFWERESELIGLILSLMVLTSGGLTTLWRYLKQRRKDRVDIYYLKVLQVADKARAATSIDEKKFFLKELHTIRNNAFDQLVRENLDANESFTIFTNLLNAAISELENDLRTVQTLDV